MTTDNYILFTIIIDIVYLASLLRKRRYQLILPSTIACFTWIVACILMYAEIKGWISVNPLSENTYVLVAPFIFGMNLCAILCFIIAHIYVDGKNLTPSIYIQNGQTLEMCDNLLRKYRWILWVCVGVGFALIVFFFSLGINFTSFSDYRVVAVTVKKVGYASLAQRIGGHIGILGAFYIIILGYKQSQSSIDLKELLKCILMYSSVNISIGGRVWLLSSILPYFTGYLLGKSVESRKSTFGELKKLVPIIVVAICFFSILGNLRSDANHQLNFFEKFLYYTDGPKMANRVMNTFPEGSYSLEYGQANFLNFIQTSPMTMRFNDSIKDNIALTVTVRSSIPALYYDFGYIGGMIMWGILCGILEIICLKLEKKGTLFSIITFGTCAVIPFQAPVGSVFALATPSFEWILLLCLLRNHIFKSFNSNLIPCKN